MVTAPSILALAAAHPQAGPGAPPIIPAKIISYRTLSGGKAEVKQGDSGIAVSLPSADRDGRGDDR